MEAAEKAAQGILDPNLDLDRIMREWAGRPQKDIWEDLSGDEQKAEALMERYRKWYWEKTTNEVELFPGIRAMLDELKGRGLGLGIVTSKARLLRYDGRPYGAVVEMERLGLGEMFDPVVGWEDVRENKPAPAAILLALERLGIGKTEALMVGDSHIDVIAAKRAGVLSAGATWGTVAMDLLIRAGPDYLVDHPSRLCPLVS